MFQKFIFSQFSSYRVYFNKKIYLFNTQVVITIENFKLSKKCKHSTVTQFLTQ